MNVSIVDEKAFHEFINGREITISTLKHADWAEHFQVGNQIHVITNLPNVANGSFQAEIIAFDEKAFTIPSGEPDAIRLTIKIKS